MDESETIYTSILAAEYVEEQDTFDVDIRYDTELPARIPDDRSIGYSKFRELADRLQEENQTTAFSTYAACPSLGLDEAFEEYFEEEDETVYWTTWMKDNGYDEFVQVLSDMEKGGEVYLLASQDPLPEDIIRDEAIAHLHNLKQQREQQQLRWGHWRSF